jgi:RND superfamily putative drug exporter
MMRRRAVFSRLGPWCHDHRKLVLGLWLGALVLFQGVSGSVGGAFREEFNLPNVESKQGFDILKEDFGGEGTGLPGQIVFRAPKGVEDPEIKAGMEAYLDRVAQIDGVTRVVSPYSKAGARQISSSGPEAGKIAYAEVEMPDDFSSADFVRVRKALVDGDPDAESPAVRRKAPKVAGVQIELGGQILAEFENPSSEALGLAFAIVILILAFGSVLAMGLPVGVAMFGIGIGTAIVTLLSHGLAIPEFATFLGVMIGLGVGIDYALLVVTRYREQLHSGHDERESIGIAMNTAGRSVLFAGVTVVISLLSMMLVGVKFVQGLAVGAASVVAVTIVASLTLLPALLAFAGTRVELTRRRGLIAAGLFAVGLVGFGLSISPMLVGFPLGIVVLVAGLFFAPLKVEVRHRAPKPLRETPAYRWSRLIQHRPWTSAVVATVALLVLAVPVLSLRLGFSDESNFAPETSTRKAYDLLVDGFGPGFAGPFLLVAELPKGSGPDVVAGMAAITEAAAKDPGVAFVSPPEPNDAESPTAVRWYLVAKTGPQAEATAELVDRLRDDILPPVERDLGTDVKVTGTVAVNLDFSGFLQSRLPLFFATVLGLSFLLLMAVFRSLLVPLKAVIMNLLSIAAAYGVVVALFQWGWLSDITGVQPAPIEPWAPMMLFSIVFGLSMDYEVFLLSRVREEWHRTGDSRTSVADGLAATAKVITAAAAIMVVVFGSFLLENNRVLKLMGTGLATAILLDATIVRMLLVPATMELLGDKNWWLPRWLDKLLPTIDVEGAAVEQAAPGPAPVGATAD